jgi:hypothetical protein
MTANLDAEMLYAAQDKRVIAAYYIVQEHRGNTLPRVRHHAQLTPAASLLKLDAWFSLWLWLIITNPSDDDRVYNTMSRR